MSTYINIAAGLKYAKETYPHKRAIVCPAGKDARGRARYTQMTFTQLDQASDRLAFGLERAGITRGTRTILMVMPGIEFFTIIFAMLKVGAVPVVVDPGMGLKRMLLCLSEGKPFAFIGIEKAHLLRVLRPGYFKTVKHWVTVGRRWCWGGYTLDQLYADTNEPYPSAKTTKNETAAIVFTTGSTGPAKGVVYTHGNFDAQIKQIRTHFKIEPDEIDLPTFPLFALFDPALGMTAVIPDMDPTRPAHANPKKIIQTIQDHGVTNMFASPALLNRLGKYGRENRIKLPSLRRVVSAGAPVSPANIEQFSGLIPDDTEVHTPYGATEAVPVISIGSHEILSETRTLSEKGFGFCIGRPINKTQVAIIKIKDSAINQFRNDILVENTQVGEIMVKGDLVTKHYFNNQKADLLSKVPDTDNTIWHRMGDLGWQDSKGRIWFCGRKSHRVITREQVLFTIPVEAIFNNHTEVFRSALAGVGHKNAQTPVIFIEPKAKIKDTKTFIRELKALGSSNQLTAGIEHFFIEKSFPVDIRHNSKIFREKLAEKARKKLKIS
jgi:olefin beta-lactone synthetase